MSLHRVEHVMGMPISLEVCDLETGADEVFAWLREVDETYSTYKEDSVIRRLARGEITVDDCPDEVGSVLGMCERVRQATNGWFDVRASGILDPSGFVKGWAIERASKILAALGSSNHCINAGGDVRCRGERDGEPWQIGVLHPFDDQALTVVVAGRDYAVATSGTSARGEHIFDPVTNRPATALASVTMIGPELTLTDAYATAAFAMGFGAPAWLETLPDHEAYVIDAGGFVWTTPGFSRYAVPVG